MLPHPDLSSPTSSSCQPGYPLKSLLLEDCSIGDKGAAALADAIRVNETLQKLSLVHNELTADAVFALVAALNVNTSITEYEGPGEEQWAPLDERRANRAQFLVKKQADTKAAEEAVPPPTSCCIIA